MNELAKKLTMPKMEITCALCGNDLEVIDESPYKNWHSIQIEVCEHCGDYDKGYEKGREEGHEEGYDEGFDANHDENYAENELDETFDKGRADGFKDAHKLLSSILSKGPKGGYKKLLNTYKIRLEEIIENMEEE